ncbi:MAG TPA: DUF4388 domain-containing protein [Thermoanaerobaculia bacterium]|nr:DUF4388 domain-containing protein [Thermoanaerobaculia bacterium]
MSLFGRLEDLSLPQVLQLLSMNRLSGKLSVTRQDARGTVVLRDGKVIFATTNTARETVGSLLLLKRLVSVSRLTEALEIQGASPQEKRLGTILVEMGAIDPATLRQVVAEQFARVLGELFGWRSGYLRFQHLAVEERGEVAIDAHDFLFEEGIATDGLVLRVMAEAGDERTERAAGRAFDRLIAESGDPDGARPVRRTSLKEIMAELRAPAFPGEVGLHILRFADGFFRRGALFLATGRLITGIGQFGFDHLGDRGVRKVRVPADQPSVFLDVIETRESYVGPLEETFWNAYLAGKLCGRMPRQVAVLPLAVGDRVELLLYGDDEPVGDRLPDLEPLEVLMIEAGLALEKRSLEARLRALEGRQTAAAAGEGAARLLESGVGGGDPFPAAYPA